EPRAAVVGAVGERRPTWWVLAELGRRLGHELTDTSGEDATDDARLATITAGARCSFDEVVAAGWVEKEFELPAPWVDAHVDRLGGWRLAPRMLDDQLAALKQKTAPLLLLPRRHIRHPTPPPASQAESPHGAAH